MIVITVAIIVVLIVILVTIFLKSKTKDNNNKNTDNSSNKVSATLYHIEPLQHPSEHLLVQRGSRRKQVNVQLRNKKHKNRTSKGRITYPTGQSKNSKSIFAQRQLIRASAYGEVLFLIFYILKHQKSLAAGKHRQNLVACPLKGVAPQTEGMHLKFIRWMVIVRRSEVHE